MSWEAQKDVILGFLASGVSGWVLYEMHEMRRAMEKLNISLVEILTKTKFHEKTLDAHDERLERLEWGNKR